MSNSQPNNQGSAFKFNIDVLVRGSSNAEVKKKLLQLLGDPDILDIQINARAEQKDYNAGSVQHVEPPHLQSQQPKAVRAEHERSSSESIEIEIKKYISHRTLVRLEVNKAKGVRLSMPVRILNYDASNMLLNVYHDDEKSVYAFHLYEIENMTPYSK
ncbi:hypothetical protein [Paenibacillus aquistagni]|uniref:Uncharacterized protein n=1 Tax=Paenibacillus aquistagni TaxID=1852522 RepID=A0A1X7LKJ4_9BACL|nr:hypothetical protein [Paenibacillus aquistagni]SMG54408.1 hypothetical protein SAMN06295960_3708 [Paenibacillus aquistagni]